MSAVDPFRPKTWTVAQQSALADAVRAVVIGDPSMPCGFAVLAEGEITVESFPDAESMHRALAAIYTRRGRWQYPLSWEAVLFFGPDEPLRLYLEPEVDDELDEGGVAQ